MCIYIYMCVSYVLAYYHMHMLVGVYVDAHIHTYVHIYIYVCTHLNLGFLGLLCMFYPNPA